LVLRFFGFIWAFLVLFNLPSTRPLDRWIGRLPPNGTIAFVDVGLIPMTTDHTRVGQTVVVHNGIIAAIGDSAQIQIPAGAERIDGRGLYLMPGLVDMHFHLHNAADALLLVANGVTTIRNMRGTYLHLAWRKKSEEGTLLVPTIYTCGPILDGNPPTGENLQVVDTPEEAEEDVAIIKQEGFDCVKIYNRLSPENFAAIVASAKRYSLPVVGHVPAAVGLQGVLNANISSIEHLTGYMNALRNGGSEIHEEMIPALARATKAAGVWNCVTLVIQEKLTMADQPESLLAGPEIQYVAPLRLAMWDPHRDMHIQSMSKEEFAAAKRGIQYLKKITQALNREGAGLLLGTDAPSRFIVPGFSAHDELQNLVSAGLTPYEALKAGTRDAALYLGASSEFGTIEVGKRADLILLAGNPLKNIQNTKRLEGVMIRGMWLPKENLREILEAVKASYITPEDPFASMQPLPAAAVFEYKIEYDGLDVGRERFTLNSGLIQSEIITQPPFQASYEIEAKPGMIDMKSSRPEGPAELKVTMHAGGLTVNSTPPVLGEVRSWQNGTQPGKLTVAQTVAGKYLLSDLLTNLNVGESILRPVLSIEPAIFATKTTEIQEYIAHIERLPNDGPIRAFRFQWQWNHQKQNAVLKLDGSGIPVYYQEGLRSFVRIR
jgi:imidazolonepropionase-like amidohydrolase